MEVLAVKGVEEATSTQNPLNHIEDLMDLTNTLSSLMHVFVILFLLAQYCYLAHHSAITRNLTGQARASRTDG